MSIEINKCPEPVSSVRVRGPADLVQAVPYLVGFHPDSSLVLVGLQAYRVVVTVRMDLADVSPPLLDQAICAMTGGGSRSIVGVLFADGVGGPCLAEHEVLHSVDKATYRCDVALFDVLLTRQGRWWSLSCHGCCPSEGELLNDTSSALAAEATFAGLVALPDRNALAAAFTPAPVDELARIAELIAPQEDAEVQAALSGRAVSYERALKRAIFTASRRAEFDGGALAESQVARFGVGLSGIAMRDSVWMAIDERRLTGRTLWQQLCRRLPHPYDAAPAFLAGWQAWRSGNGALARIAAHRALEADPGYSAADLLLSALSRGVDPRRMPPLRGRSTGR